MLENTMLSGFADEIHSDIEIQVKLLQELGIRYLELRSAYHKNISQFSPEEAMQLKKFLSDNQLKVSAIGSPIGKILITDDFEPHYELFQKVVEIAKIMETPYIRIFSFFIPQGHKPENYAAEVLTRLSRMIGYAAQHGIVLLHENEKEIYGDIATRCLELLEHFCSEHFRCTFDFANFVQCEQDTMEAYELLKPYIEYIHIKDARLATGEVTPPGEGDGNLSEILTRLDQAGYHGFISLEPHLAEFAGLQSLEHNVAKRSLTDGEAAFTIAYQAYRKLV